MKTATPIQRTLEQRELTEEEKQQVFQRDGYTCQCCGKQRGEGRRVRFEVDHIVPFRFGGETSLANSQTLCSICHKDKSINSINFRILKSPLDAPRPTLELKMLSSAEYVDEELKRVVNLFYYCKAVAHINCDTRPNSKYRYKWEIVLFEGNNPAWLTAHKDQLISFIRQRLNNPKLQELEIR